MKADIIIVGAGPAGLSAAIEAAKLSANVLVIDENNQLGGRVLSHSVDLKKNSPWFVQSQRLKALNDGVSKYSKNITFLSGCTVWGKSIDGALLIAGEEKSIPPEVEGDAYILANGAIESIIPFPGWTLPGVVPKLWWRLMRSGPRSAKFSPKPPSATPWPCSRPSAARRTC